MKPLISGGYETKLKRLASWIKSHSDLTAIVFLLLLLVGVAFLLQGWNQPLIKDRTFHLYSSQEIARGRIPYVDFFNIHPPMGIILSAIPMWLFPNLRTGEGPALTHSALTIIWSALGVIAMYFISKRINNGNWLAGLLAALIWLLLTPVFLREFSVGQNRLLVVSALLLTTALLQNGKWFWAGLSLGVGFMTYYPAILGAATIVIVFQGRKSSKWFLKIVQFSAGFFTLVGSIAFWLAWKGAFFPWINVTLRWPLALVIGDSLAGGSSGPSILDRFGQLIILLPKSYQAGSINLGWLPILGLFAFFGFSFYFLSSGERRKIFFTDKTSFPVVVMTSMFMLYNLVETGILDFFMLDSFLTIWAAMALTLLLSNIKSISAKKYRVSVISLALVIGISGLLLVITIKNVFEFGNLRKWREPLQTNSAHINLTNQIAASDALFSHIGSEKQIIVLGDLWLLITSGRENPSPFYHTGEKMRLSAKLAGYISSENDIYDELAEINPDMFIISHHRRGAEYENLTSTLFESGYICVGQAGEVMNIIHPNDLNALIGSFAMQQKFFPSVQVDSGLGESVIDIMSLNRIKDINIREVAPGILLLKDELISGTSLESVFYWWVWAEPKDQMNIRFEMKTSERIIFSQLLNKNRFVPHVLIKQVVSLGDISDIPNDAKIQIWAQGRQPKTSACNRPFSVESDTLILNQDFSPNISTGN